VDSDELSGLCVIGSGSVVSQHSTGLVEFVVGPMVAFLVVGVCLVAAGFAAVYRVRRTLRRGGGSVERLERLMVKMGTFSVLYVGPAVCVLGCLLYEKRGAPAWDGLARRTPCARPDGLDRCPLDESIPAVEVFLVKTFMSLMPGVATGVWIWSVKTLTSWRRRLAVCVGGGRRQMPVDGESVKQARSGRRAGSDPGGRLVRWSTGLKGAPALPSFVSGSHPSHQPFTIS